MKKVNQVNMENSSSLNSSIMESIEGIETVKIFNAADYTFRNTEEKFRSFLRSSKKQGYLSNLSSSVSAFISSAGVILILWCGVVQISKGNITLGELLTFNALVEYFIDPIKNMINLYPSVQSAIVASDRLWEILDIECERNTLSSKTEMSLDGDIVIDDLTFSYGKGSPILKNVSLSIRRGQKIALVGESGSGKTTIARLLLKLYECGDNMIKINDKDINSISTELLRDRVAYISQETFLFSESVYNNLIFGKNDADEESVLKAAKFSQADDFIMKLPLAYSTRLGEKGVNISGGQKQCIAIARALLKDPDILIMDEATSNLDNITEKAVENAINNQDITTIIIAHRLSTIKNCDVIYVMDNGRIVESGNHLQLLKQRGRYYDLWCSQF
jgi:ATP-binding cassette subfamily B protein